MGCKMVKEKKMNHCRHAELEVLIPIGRNNHERKETCKLTITFKPVIHS